MTDMWACISRHTMTDMWACISRLSSSSEMQSYRHCLSWHEPTEPLQSHTQPSVQALVEQARRCVLVDQFAVARDQPRTDVESADGGEAGDGFVHARQHRRPARKCQNQLNSELQSVADSSCSRFGFTILNQMYEKPRQGLYGRSMCQTKASKHTVILTTQDSKALTLKRTPASWPVAQKP